MGGTAQVAVTNRVGWAGPVTRTVLRSIVIAGAAGAAYLALSLFDGPARADEPPGPLGLSSAVTGLLGGSESPKAAQTSGDAVTDLVTHVLSTSDGHSDGRSEGRSDGRDEPPARGNDGAGKRNRPDGDRKPAESRNPRKTEAAGKPRRDDQAATASKPQAVGITASTGKPVPEKPAGESKILAPVLRLLGEPTSVLQQAGVGISPLVETIDVVVGAVLDPPALHDVAEVLDTARPVVNAAEVTAVRTVSGPAAEVVTLAAPSAIAPLAAPATMTEPAGQPVRAVSRDPPARRTTIQRPASAPAPPATPADTRVAVGDAGPQRPVTGFHQLGGPGAPPDPPPAAPESVAGGSLRAGGEGAPDRPALAGRSTWQPELAIGLLELPANTDRGGRSAEADAPSG